jgi:hypothetical protein
VSGEGLEETRRVLCLLRADDVGLGRTMTKLGLTGRAQAVVVAYERRLLTPGTENRRRDG